MSHFDDWRPPQDDWGNKNEASDFVFESQDLDDFGFIPREKESPTARLRRLPPWAKITAPVVGALLIAFIALQAGVPGLVRSLGLFRETVSASAACLNSYQVLAAASTGTVNQIAMNRAVDFATRLKGQESPDQAVNEAMWAVSDATFALDRALANADFSVTLADVTTGDFADMGFTPELNEAALELSAATSMVNSACTDIDVAGDLGGIVAQEPDTPDDAPEEPRNTLEEQPEAPVEVDAPDVNPSVTTDEDGAASDGLPGQAEADEAISESDLISLAKQATFYVECWTGGDEVATGTAFLANLANAGVAAEGSQRIVTNHHVIEDCLSGGELALQDESGQWFEATVIDADAVRDIAFLESQAGVGLQALDVEPEFAIGQEVILSGHPDGIDTAVTFGRVTVFDQEEYLIFSDALAGPGSSGGPMINKEGRVVGIVTYILEVTRGMSIASPIDAVCIDLEDC